MNKKFLGLVLMFTLLISTNSFAGVNVFGGYDLTTKSDFIVNGTTASFNHGGGLLIGAEYYDVLNEILNFSVGGSLLFDRMVTSCTVPSGTCSVNPNATIGSTLVYGNLRYAFMTGAYVQGGLNYNFPRATSLSAGSSISGKFGIQAGIGYAVTEQITVEGNYHIINADSVTSGSTTSTMSNAGFDVKVKYAL
jgi:opacity protein-like surface antigen